MAGVTRCVLWTRQKLWNERSGATPCARLSTFFEDTFVNHENPRVAERIGNRSTNHVADSSPPAV